MPRGVKFLPQDLGAIAKAYQDGETAEEIGKRCGTSRDTIFRLLRAHGVPVRKGGHPRAPVEPDEIARMYRRGYTLTELSRIFNCDRNTITRRLVEAGARTHGHRNNLEGQGPAEEAST